MPEAGTLTNGHDIGAYADRSWPVERHASPPGRNAGNDFAESARDRQAASGHIESGGQAPSNDQKVMGQLYQTDQRHSRMDSGGMAGTAYPSRWNNQKRVGAALRVLLMEGGPYALAFMLIALVVTSILRSL